ncbi:hypothetical protein M422DRAFT_251494 [Sphaerobolus stellatus SS14]|uniref:Uncharacterized protein n=1 Tax=Sphaerobolus stellatus (strain SS14) TaxID=990650 RepID=A0A0C9W1M8_SPHS4|nr:hypothetical protein M422DRAFT_251494 [Sphaerobolus stellatus SS14]
MNEEDDAAGYHLHYASSFVTNSGNILVDIRIYQLPSIRPHPEGTIAFIFGKFQMSGPYKMEIEAVHIFKYPAYVTGHILPTFSPRVTIAGHVLQDVQELSDGTKLIIINAMDFVRDYHQVVTVIAAMTPNNRWPIKPPTPKKNSPIRITGFIDCIDNQSRLPVITIEELTLELGNKRVAELANHARIERLLLKRKIHTTRETETVMELIMADKYWKYTASTASLSSIPPYGNPYPLPFPLEPTSWGRSKPVELEYLPLRYPAPLSDVEELEEEVCEGSAANELGLEDERGEDVETGDEGESSAEEAASAESEEEEGQSEAQKKPQMPLKGKSTSKTNLSQALSDATLSDDQESVPDGANKASLDSETIYLEDIPVIHKIVDQLPSKKRKTPPKAASTSRTLKRIKPLPSSQPTLNHWVVKGASDSSHNE